MHTDSKAAKAPTISVARPPWMMPVSTSPQLVAAQPGLLAERRAQRHGADLERVRRPDPGPAMATSSTMSSMAMPAMAEGCAEHAQRFAPGARHGLACGARRSARTRKVVCGIHDSGALMRGSISR
jgi:hypothetical protein